jgi:hypothetical protein
MSDKPAETPAPLYLWKRTEDALAAGRIEIGKAKQALERSEALRSTSTDPVVLGMTDLIPTICARAVDAFQRAETAAQNGDLAGTCAWIGATLAHCHIAMEDYRFAIMRHTTFGPPSRQN